jgi:ABC-type methionine transport system permease subunit
METSILELVKDAPYALLIVYMMWFASAIVRQAIDAQTAVILALIDRLPDYKIDR